MDPNVGESAFQFSRDGGCAADCGTGAGSAVSGSRWGARARSRRSELVDRAARLGEIKDRLTAVAGVSAATRPARRRHHVAIRQSSVDG